MTIMLLPLLPLLPLGFYLILRALAASWLQRPMTVLKIIFFLVLFFSLFFSATFTIFPWVLTAIAVFLHFSFCAQSPLFLYGCTVQYLPHTLVACIIMRFRWLPAYIHSYTHIFNAITLCICVRATLLLAMREIYAAFNFKQRRRNYCLCFCNLMLAVKLLLLFGSYIAFACCFCIYRYYLLLIMLFLPHHLQLTIHAPAICYIYTTVAYICIRFYIHLHIYRQIFSSLCIVLYELCTSPHLTQMLLAISHQTGP